MPKKTYVSLISAVVLTFCIGSSMPPSGNDEQILPKSGIFYGMTNHSARVVTGSNLQIKGMICGDLIVEPGARVLMSGMVDGKIIADDGAEVTITGMVG